MKEILKFFEILFLNFQVTIYRKLYQKITEHDHLNIIKTRMIL